MVHLWPSAQSGARFEAKASLRTLTLVQAADQSAAGQFCLWAPVVQSLSAPLQRGLRTWIDHLLLWRHVQPAKKQQAGRKLNELNGKKQVQGLETQSLIYFLYRPEMKTSYRLA